MDYTDKTIRSNRIFTVIRNFARLFPDEFEKCDIKSCGHCRGRGYKDYTLPLFIQRIRIDKITGRFLN